MGACEVEVAGCTCAATLWWSFRKSQLCGVRTFTVTAASVDLTRLPASISILNHSSGSIVYYSEFSVATLFIHSSLQSWCHSPGVTTQPNENDARSLNGPPRSPAETLGSGHCLHTLLVPGRTGGLVGSFWVRQSAPYICLSL